MRRIVAIILLLLYAIGIPAQEFIGCRTDSGWAETPMLRKKFILEVIPEFGIFANISSLGYHKLYINNVEVGNRVLQPAVSQLNKRALTVRYDISPYVHEGENEIMLCARRNRTLDFARYGVSGF